MKIGDFSEKDGRRKEVEAERAYTRFRLVEIIFQICKFENVTNEGDFAKAEMFTGIKQLDDADCLTATNSINSRGHVLALSRLETQ